MTPYPAAHNAALLAALDAANINIIGTGAEGGLPNQALITEGNTLDGNDFSYWYAADNIQITAQQRGALDVMNGANNSVNPLYYDQNGVNRLQDGQVQNVRSCISSGVLTGGYTRTTLSQADFLNALENGDFDGLNVVNAVPLVIPGSGDGYLQLNPGDFDKGDYNGITIAAIPMRSFKHIVFNVLLTDLVTA